MYLTDCGGDERATGAYEGKWRKRVIDFFAFAFVQLRLYMFNRSVSDFACVSDKSVMS